MHWRVRRWVKVTKPELVDDGGDATLERHKSTEREDACANDGSLPDPVCQVQIKGLNIKWECTVPRRLALRRSSTKAVTSSLAVTCAAPASVIEFVAPSPAAAYAAPDPVFKYASSSPAVTSRDPSLAAFTTRSAASWRFRDRANLRRCAPSDGGALRQE